MTIIGWILGILLMTIPVWLSIFTIFLMVTNKPLEDEQIDWEKWGADIDDKWKNRYNSDSY